MTIHRPVLLFGIDAGNPTLLRSYVEAGHLPNLARVIESGRSATVEHEPGLYIGAIWPTLLTGVGVDRHGFYTGIRPAPGSYAYVPAAIDADPFWVEVSRQGRSVAVVDAPFFPARPDIDADQIVEWGCHDRYWGPSSQPEELLDEVVRGVGRHPIGMIDHEYQRFAPCDWIHRSGQHRSPAEVRSFLADLDLGMQSRIELARAMHRKGSYDLYVDVIAETHCAGHHLWSLHDASHPDHDPATRAAIGDPLLPTYRRVDELLGVHLAAMGPDTLVFVLASHGMRSHFDGTHLLDEVLWRLDQKYRGAPRPWMGPRSSRLERLVESTRRLGFRSSAEFAGPVVTRSFGRRSPTPTTPSTIPGPGQRLWYQLENNTVSGAVRFNRLGREPDGLLDVGLIDHAGHWLIDELRSIINIDTGRPVVPAAFLTESMYERHLDDGLPDLIVEWTHDVPIERIWSPSFGTICAPYLGTRTGDHDGTGELFVMGGGITDGPSTTIRPVDLAPTVAAAAGTTLTDSDGAVSKVLLGDHTTDHALSGGAPGPATGTSIGATDDVTALRRSLLELRHEVNGLRAAHHETRVLADEAVRRAAVATDVIATAAWIEAQRVDTDLLISVIMPTHDRAHLLPTAIASVLEQTYPNLEIVVVDDGSTDDTASVLDQLTDPRVRLVTNRTNIGEAGSRNVGLDNAHGDIVCFLDDDNTFHRDWLRSVVWLFHAHRDTEVAYGARLMDDVDRHRIHESGGLPFLELNEWDESINREQCLIDINVLAHRPGLARFDRALPLFADWVYLRELTREVKPVRLPVIATRYTTDSPDRVTFAQRHRHDELYHRARSAGTDPTDDEAVTSV